MSIFGKTFSVRNDHMVTVTVTLIRRGVMLIFKNKSLSLKNITCYRKQYASDIKRPLQNFWKVLLRVVIGK